MRGHEPILAMRRAGAAPISVWVNDQGEDYTPETSASRGWMTRSARACVELLPSDNPRTLDLRFLVGMTVHLQSRSERRMQEFIDSAMACGAHRVIGSVTTANEYHATVHRVTDTAGAFTWEPEHGAAAA